MPYPLFAALLLLPSVPPPLHEPQPIQAPEGLQPHETWRILPLIEAPSANPWMDWEGLRVLDAVLGEPIEGARFDLYLEDYYSPEETARPVASALTGADGAAYVPRPRALSAGALGGEWEKFVVSADGYKRAGEALGHGQGELLLWRTQPLKVEFRNFAGQPIEGAVIRSIHTCRHEAPSFLGRSDARGRMDLSEFPAAFDDASARIFAPGYRAFGGESPHDLVWQVAANGKAVLYLPRSRSIRVRLLDGQGQPSPNQRLLLGTEPWRLARTDSKGLASFDSLPDTGGHNSIRILQADGMQGERYLTAELAQGHMVSARMDSARGVELIQPLAILRVRGLEELSSRFLSLNHRQGQNCGDEWLGQSWAKAEGPVLERSVPLGQYTLVVGQPFSGWCEQVYEFEVTEGGFDLVIDPEPEPVLRIFTGGSQPAWETMWIQADDDSYSLSGDFRDYYEQSVPLGADVTLFWYEFGDGKIYDSSMIAGAHRLHLGIIDEGRTVDRDQLLAAETVRKGISRAAWPRETVVVRALERASGTQELELASTSVRVGELLLQSNPSAREVPTRRVYDLPINIPAQVMVQSDGYASLGRELTPAEHEPSDLLFRLRRLGSLRITGRAVVALVGGEVWVGNDLDPGLPLRPGPHTLYLIDAEGVRVALELDLQPGAERTIHW